MVGFLLPWPALMIPRESKFTPENQSRSGGLSLTGSEQVTASNAGRWRASLVIPISGEERVLAMRAFLSQLSGRAGTALVPKFERHGPRDLNGRRLNQLASAPIGDGLNFDLSGLGQDDHAAMTLVDNAALGATRIVASLNNIDGPRPGQYFGIGQRLHLCENVWQVEVGGPTHIQFWPRLRSAAPAGSTVILDRPVCLMRLADDASGDTMLDMNRWGVVTLDFVEAI